MPPLAPLGRRLVLALGVLAVARGGEEDHYYKIGERVDLWVNKIGPYHNPQETYEYYDLPFCKPTTGIETRRKSHSLGEQLEGHELRNSGYELFFTQDVKNTKICSTQLTKDDAARFASAVEEHYWYQLYLDDLPIWGMVGETFVDETEGATKKVIYTHRRLNIGYNGNYIIEVNMTSENPQIIKEGNTLDFSYSVLWEPSTKSFENRFDRYLDFDFFGHQIHWFSIFNSTMMVVFLCGLVSLILFRTLRNDFARYAQDDEEGDGLDRGISEDSGWKQVHGDVFRAPSNLMLFSTLYGVGWQLIILIFTVISFAIAGPLHGDVYEERGELATAVIVCYALTCAIAGYCSGSYYRQYFPTPRAEQASQWQKTMLLTVLLFPTVVVSVIFLLNLIAEYYDTTNALHLSTIFKMFAIWLFVSFPLTVVGTMFGRHWAGKSDFPCRVNSMARPIPKGPWYTSPWVIMMATGVLPFGSIFIEMYFIFTSFWNYKFYFVYGFMLLVYMILIVVSSCTTIVAVYFILNAENYHWQWISFLSSGSTAIYVYFYSIYYFWWKTKMSGLLQVSFYFGYMFLFCFALFLLCGSIGVAGSTLFVKRIYRNIKVD